MTDKQVDEYLNKAIKAGLLNPEDFDGMTWAEVVAFVKKLVKEEKK